MPELLEREELLSQLAAARAKGGRLVFVAGEAGVVRSRYDAAKLPAEERELVRPPTLALCAQVFRGVRSS